MTAIVSKDAAKIINAFAAAARRHGWEQDQGGEHDAIKAKLRYHRTYNALVKYVAELEKANAKPAP